MKKTYIFSQSSSETASWQESSEVEMNPDSLKEPYCKKLVFVISRSRQFSQLCSVALLALFIWDVSL